MAKFRCISSGNVFEFHGFDAELMKKNHSYIPVGDDAVSEPTKKNVRINIESGLKPLRKNPLQKVGTDGSLEPILGN